MRSREYRIRMKNKHTKRRLKKYARKSWYFRDINNVFHEEDTHRYINMLNSYSYFIAKETGTTFTVSRYKKRYSRNKSKKSWFEKGTGNTRIEQKEKFREILKENGII